MKPIFLEFGIVLLMIGLGFYFVGSREVIELDSTPGRLIRGIDWMVGSPNNLQQRYTMAYQTEM